MQRSLWKGAISFGLVHIPVHLYAAENSHQLDLDMLDRRDFAPIGYKRINKQTGREVEWDNIVKGYEYESGQYVVLSDEDLKRANVKATGTIDILTFVDAHEVPQIYYERPYYLTPDKGGGKVYALLRETLRRSNKIGIAQIVLRTKQHLVALFPMDEIIVLNTLRYADEIRSADQFDLPESSLKQVGITDKEIKMALSLVDGMTEHWDAADYHDTYREDVLAMVQQKIKTHQTKAVSEPEEAQPKPSGGAQIIDLMALLKQSLGEKATKASPAGSARTTAKKTAAKKTAPTKSSTVTTGKKTSEIGSNTANTKVAKQTAKTAKVVAKDSGRTARRARA